MVYRQPDNATQQPAEYIDEIDFQKYWLVVKRRWLPAFVVFAGTVGLAMMAVLQQDAVYQAEGKVRIKSDRSSSLTGLDENLGEIGILSGGAEPLETQVEIAESLPVMAKAIEELGLTNSEGEPLEPQALRGAVSIEAIAGTEVLRILSQSDDPEEATAIVNNVIEAYRELNIESNKEEAAAARRFIEEQLPTIEQRVLDAELAVRTFKEANGVVILDEETSNAVSRLSDLEQQIEQAQVDLSDLTAQSTRLEQQLGLTASEAMVLSALNESEGVQTALINLQTVQSELAELRALYSDNHPETKVLLREVDQAKALLQQRIEAVAGQSLPIPMDQVDFGKLQLGNFRVDQMGNLADLEVRRVGLAERLGELTQTRDRYVQQMDNLPALEEEQRQLERQLQAAQGTYEALLSQLQEVRVVENQTVGNVQIVSLAQVPKGPIGPSRKLYLVVGGGLGILLAIATAFLLDLLDSSVKTIKEVKELYGYTLLGVIPLVKEGGRSDTTPMVDAGLPRLLVHQHAHTAVREAYQILQANLKFLQSDSELKTVVLTSAVPGEGKSEVTANLAAALAQVGRKVLVVDADMRCPRQHHAMNVMNQQGLSHVITGQAALRDCIRPVMKNLDVLTAGAVPPNPVALLDSKRMQSLLRSLSQHFDMVLIDAPPLAGYADASILGRIADGILLVVRPGVVDYAQGRNAKGILMQSQQRVLGMVANGINPVNEPDGHFYLRQDRYASANLAEQPEFLEEPDSLKL
jgi:succinoglycan biosynthesis transport protein ExoP